MIKKLWSIIKEWKEEAVGVLLAFLLFVIAPSIYRFIDPTAGSYDVGVLQLINFSLVSILTFSFLSWLGIKINFKEIFQYLQTDFQKDFNSLEKWQKVKISLLLYLSYLLLFVIMAKAI